MTHKIKRRVFYSEIIRSSPLTLLQLKLFACCLSEVSKQERNAVEFCGGNGERESERNKQTNKQTKGGGKINAKYCSSL